MLTRTFSKEHLLHSLEQIVDKHLAEAIDNYQNLPESTLLRPSILGGWSVAQCLDHLNSYGDYYIPQIEKALQSNNKNGFNKDFKSGFLGNYFVKIMDPQTSTRKYKAFKGHVPSKNLVATKVVAEFINQQEMLLNLLEKANDLDLNKIKIPISISRFIRLNLGDVFRFIIAHNERHMQQASRNLQTPFTSI